MFIYLIFLTTIISVINSTNIQVVHNKIYNENLVPDSVARMANSGAAATGSDIEAVHIARGAKDVAVMMNEGQGDNTNDDGGDDVENSEVFFDGPVDPVKQNEFKPDTGRSIDGENEYKISMQDTEHNEQHEAFRRRAKPFKNIFMGIYKNYKSTYLGNKTVNDYKKTLFNRPIVVADNPKDSDEGNNNADYEIERVDVAEASAKRKREHENDKTPEQHRYQPVRSGLTQNHDKRLNDVGFKLKPNKQRRYKQRKDIHGKARKNSKIAPPSGRADDPLIYAHANEYRYNMGPGVNMSLDLNNDLVSVNLDADNLRELMYRVWYKREADVTEQGRGKKYSMITRVLPLFILPFLIQSAVVPFLVTKLKLLLMKSILIGKLAIFLLIISAIKNSNKHMQTYEVAPSYWAGEPSRRSELAAAASSAAYNGYRVEGKPAAWIN